MNQNKQLRLLVFKEREGGGTEEVGKLFGIPIFTRLRVVNANKG